MDGWCDGASETAVAAIKRHSLAVAVGADSLISAAHVRVRSSARSFAQTSLDRGRPACLPAQLPMPGCLLYEDKSPRLSIADYFLSGTCCNRDLFSSSLVCLNHLMRHDRHFNSVCALHIYMHAVVIRSLLAAVSARLSVRDRLLRRSGGAIVAAVCAILKSDLHVRKELLSVRPAGRQRQSDSHASLLHL